MCFCANVSISKTLLTLPVLNWSSATMERIAKRAKETAATDKSDEPSDVISSTEENNENTEADPTANSAENLATTKSEDTSPSENNEASTSE